jgi:cobalt/nickel transport system permease protein
VTLILAAFVLATGLSLVASSSPDGLEWSYKERPNQPNFQPAIENQSPAMAAADDLQTKYTPMPDYSARSSGGASWAGWTSFAGVLGSLATVLLIWISARLLYPRRAAV